MGLILRRDKGSKLSITELDNNFEVAHTNQYDWIDTWTIKNYSSGIELSINDTPQPWFSFNNVPGYTQSATYSNLRGGIIEYHAFLSGDRNGTIIGTITFAIDDTSIEPTHVEILSGGSLEPVHLWNSSSLYNSDNTAALNIIDVDGSISNIKIQWTSRLFFGKDYYVKPKGPKGL